MNRRRTAALLSLTAAAGMLVATPASAAAQPLTVYFYDYYGDYSGRATFYPDGEKLKVLDTRNDDRGVVAQLYWDKKVRGYGFDDVRAVTTGARTYDFSIPEGKYVKLRICKDGVADCSRWWSTRA